MKVTLVNGHETTARDIFIYKGQMVRVIAADDRNVRIKFPNGRLSSAPLADFIRINDELA